MRALLALLTLGAFSVRLLRLLESPEPPGTDGYAYVVQVEHWLSEGRLHFPDSSWVLRLLALGAAALGQPIPGLKWASAVLAAACVPAAWFAGLRLARAIAPDSEPPPHARSLALALAAWAAASPTLTHLSGDFPKTLGLVAPALLALGLLASRPRRAVHLLALAAALLLTATAHRLGAMLLLLGAAGALLGLVLRGRPGSPERRWPLVALGAGTLTLFAALTAVLPSLLHPQDLERVFPQLDFSLGLPPPFAWFPLRRTHALQQVELAAAWGGVVLGAWLLWRQRASRPWVAALLLPLLVCLLPLWRRGVLDLGYRTSLLAPLLAVPLVLLAIPAPVWVRLRTPALALLALALLPAARWGFDPHATPPYTYYRSLLARLPQPLPELLIAHQGVSFLYSHLTGREAMAWAPEPGLERTRIGRLVWGVKDGEWLAWAPSAPELPAPHRLDRHYVYVREDVYEAFRTRALAEGDEDLAARLADWRNPSAVRPASLLRNRR